MPSSEGPFAVSSELDVEITIYGGAGTRLVDGSGKLQLALPSGLYRVHLERGGRVVSRLVDHGDSTVLHDPGPALVTPAPLDGTATTHGYYTEPAIYFSTQ